MEKINLEKILTKHLVSKTNLQVEHDDYIFIISAMKEACRQTLELAAENAKLVECDPCEFYIDKESILNVINLIE